MHEDLDITNHGRKPVRFNLEIAIRSDFADVFEVKSEPHRAPRPHQHRVVGRAISGCSTAYRNQDFLRAAAHRCAARATSAAAYANGRLSFEVGIDPGADLALLPALRPDRRQPALPRAARLHRSASSAPAAHTDWQDTVLKIRTSNEEFYRFYRQAIEDMAALRLPIAGTDHMVFVPAAGLPWFVAPFGRDSLIVSLQNMLVYPDFARGALDVLGRWQAKERDDYRDAEPGKIMHELRYGELAHFKLIPHTPYYGTADATPLYLITLHAAWRCTGDRALLERHLADGGALPRLDRRLRRSRRRRLPGIPDALAGRLREHGWKDAGDAMVYPDGTPVKGPKALCELQGYVYDAWLRMAEIYDELGNADRAAALRDKAATLFERFNEAFWDEETRLLRLLPRRREEARC